MRLKRSDDLTDEQLLEQAMASAERWERTLANGGGHKGADRPDRSSKRKSHAGPQRKARWYEPIQAQGDLWYIVIDGQRHKVASYSVSPSHYGDDYGTGRHYQAINDVIYADPGRENHSGQRTPQARRWIIGPNGTQTATLDDGQVIRYTLAERSTRKRPTTQLDKFLAATRDPNVDDSALWHDGTTGHDAMQTQ